MVLRALADPCVRLLSVSLQKVVEICNDCRKANTDPFSKKAKRSVWNTTNVNFISVCGKIMECILLEHIFGHEKEDPVDYRPVSIPSVPGKVGDHILVEAIFKCKNNRVSLGAVSMDLGRAHHACLTNLIAFYKEKL